MIKVVLLRHASRVSQDFGDSPLSASGRMQSEDLIHLAQANVDLPKPTALLCSPKKRAQETLLPLSDALQLPLVIDSRLDERHRDETSLEFDKRIRSFIDDFLARSARGESGCFYACSHMDWLELSSALIPSDISDWEASLPWSTAEFRVFKIEDGIWRYKSRGVAQARG